MEKRDNPGRWLKERCEEGHLSLRQAATKVGLSHSTIRDIMKGKHPLPETIRKLAQGFGGDGQQRLALEELSEPLARLMDKIRQFNEWQIKIMGHFADFVSEIDGSAKSGSEQKRKEADHEVS